MEEALRNFGLSNNEIRVYKASLELGSSTVTNIAQRANIYRTLTYEILKSLSEKGLVSYVVKDRKKYFEAASPNKFISILKEKEKLIREILPDMLSIQKTVKTKPSITLYEGKEGVKTAFENILIETKDLLAITSKKAMLNLMKYYFPDFIRRRVKAKINIRLIINGKPLTLKYLDYRILKKEYSTGYWIYNNKLMIASFYEKNPVAIVIENEDIVKTMKIIFNIVWDSLSK